MFGLCPATQQVSALFNPIMPLCKSVTLAHTKEHGEDFESWHQSLDQDSAAQDITHVIIHSTPDDLISGRDDDVWQRWQEKDGHYPAFEAAIDRITELPHLEALDVSFSDQCQGADSESMWSDEVEKIESRINTLKAVFASLEKRASIPGHSPVRSLTIENLQNLPIPEFTRSSLFRRVMSDIEELHLSVVVEYNEHGPDGDVYKPERKDFEPFLQKELLAPISHNLTALSLKFDQEWGTAPGQFDGRGLSFPRLESLKLGNFIIGHHDHLDWIYAQKALKTLILRDVRIVSHILVDEEIAEGWGLRTDDWTKWPEDAFGHEAGRVFTFSDTWETVFGAIRTKLPNLVEFLLHEELIKAIDGEPQVFTNALSPLRYTAFSEGLCPSPWIEAESTGELDFAEDWDDDEEESEKEEETLNPAKSNEDGDQRALDDLLRAIKKRRG